MRIIGLTGGIACGKSTVSQWLQSQPGCAVIDADRLSRELTGPDGAALPEIRRVFGSAVFRSDGSLNRASLGDRIFSDFRARAALDSLMAPLLEDLTHERISRAREAGAELCFLDYPLLFEKGYDSLCDTVWCVDLPQELQLRRLMERDGISEADALARIRAVLPNAEKAARSQVVIDNTGSVSYTLSTLPALLERERALASAPRRRRSARYAEDDASSSPAPGAVSPDKPSTAEASFGMPEEGFGGPETAPLAGWQREAYMTESRPAPRQPSAPVPVTPRAEVPSVMERPAAARKKRSERKAEWRMPAWLVAGLIAVIFVLLSGITAQALMGAYLVRQAELHEAEQQAILNNYPLEYRDLIEKYAAEYNLQPAYVAAIIRNESSFQPRAESSVGARGLMQLMPDTAEWIAHKLKVNGYSFDRMWDPESNVRFGCWYLNYLSVLFQGDTVCVTCAYHAGQGTVTAWLSDPLISDGGKTLDLNRLIDGPTKTYAGRVIRAYGIYQSLYFAEDASAAEPAGAASLERRAGHERGKQPDRRHAKYQNADGPSPAPGGAGYALPV